MFRHHFALLVSASTALLSGCAATPPSVEETKLVESAIARAIDAGAAIYAPAELSLAQDKLALARRFLRAHSDTKPAIWLLEQSQVDAELAFIKAAATTRRTAVSDRLGELRR